MSAASTNGSNNIKPKFISTSPDQENLDKAQAIREIIETHKIKPYLQSFNRDVSMVYTSYFENPTKLESAQNLVSLYEIKAKEEIFEFLEKQNLFSKIETNITQNIFLQSFCAGNYMNCIQLALKADII